MWLRVTSPDFGLHKMEVMNDEDRMLALEPGLMFSDLNEPWFILGR